MKPPLAVCRPTSGRTGHCRWWNGSCDGGDAGDWPWPLRSPDRVRAEPSSLLSQGHRALHNKNVSEKKFFLVRTLKSSPCKLPVLINSRQQGVAAKFVHQKKEKAEKKRQVSVPCAYFKFFGAMQECASANAHRYEKPYFSFVVRAPTLVQGKKHICINIEAL